MYGGFEVVDGVVEGPEAQVFVFGTADQVVLGDSESGDGVHMRRLESGEGFKGVSVQAPHVVVSAAEVENVLKGSLDRSGVTMEKISWFLSFSSKGLERKRMSQTKRLPLLESPLPAVNR